MATKINFSKEGVNEVYTFKPTSAVVVQVERESMGFFTVYGNLDGMEKVPILNVRFEKDLIFKIDVPEKVTITMVSGTHVLEAKTEKIA